MSRPKLPEELKKSVHVLLSFTKDESIKLRMLAAQEDLDLKDYLQELARRAIQENDTARTTLPNPEDDR